MEPSSSGFAQLRIGGQAFRPDRDLVNLFPSLAQGAAVLIARNGWPGPEMRQLAQEAGLEATSLLQALPVLERFVTLATLSSVDTFEHLWEASGAARLPGIVRLALLAQIGVATVRAYHHLARQANRSGYLPLGTAETLEAMQRSAHAIQAQLPHVRERRQQEIPLPRSREGDALIETPPPPS